MKYPISHFSYSSLQLFHSCRYCWKEKYLHNRRPDVVYPFFEYGNKYHAQVHNYHTNKNFDEKFIESYTQRFPKNYRLKSETSFKVFLNGIDLPLFGFIDGIIDGGICDLKTGNTKPNSKDNIQVILYSQVYRQMNKKEPVFVFNHVSDKKINNILCTASEDDFKKLREEKIYPFLEMIQKPIEIDGMERTIHFYQNCPFRISA